MNRRNLSFHGAVWLATLVLLATLLPASAGLFRWTHLGRLIPQSGFEPSVSVLAGQPSNKDILYAGTLRSTDNTALVFRSNNAGLSWQAASAGLPDDMPQNTGVNALLIRADAPNTLYAGLYRAGVWLSTNGGQSWTNATSGSIATSDTVNALDANHAQPKLMYALTATGMHVSSSGSPWQARSNGLPSPNAALFNDLAADPTTPGTVFAATGPTGVYRTANDGLSWTPANDGLPAGDLNVRGIAIGPVSGRILISVAGQGLWRSDNGGGSWTRSDNGITYNTTLQGNVGIPTFSPTEAGSAFVYNNDGAFESKDGGKTWTPFNEGFAGNETLATMAFHPAAAGTVYVGTSVSGAWSLTIVPEGQVYVPVTIR